MQLRPALASDCAALSALAYRAKAHWGYTPQDLAAWSGELTLAADSLHGNPTTVCESARGEILGFYQLRPTGDGLAAHLDHLWVEPAHTNHGIGRALLRHALALAAGMGLREVHVDADPNAEAFYLAGGARSVGEVLAPLPGMPARVRPQLRFRINESG